jgi:hypothetical protein
VARPSLGAHARPGELRHDCRLAGRGHDRGFCNLQPTRIGAVQPPADEILVGGEGGHPRLVGGLLVHGLPIEADDRETSDGVWVSRMSDRAASA